MPPSSLRRDRAALRERVLAHSVRRGRFTLKSGAQSDWFLDTKQTVCRPEGLLLVADAALPVIPDDVTAIGGQTMGADPVAFDRGGTAAAAASSQGIDFVALLTAPDLGFAYGT